MTRSGQKETRSDLRRLLQAGDPAADGRAPDTDELAAWRHAALLEAGRAPAASLLRPVLLPVAAALACAALLAFLILDRAPAEGPAAPVMAQAPPAAPQAATDADTSASPPAGPDGPDRELTGVADGSVEQLARAEDVPAPALQPAAPAPAPLPAAMTPPDPSRPATAAVARTVQFTAPGGTRIIWTLNPDLRLSPKGASS